MRRLAVLAAVPLLALMLGAGTAAAAPAHEARATVPQGTYNNGDVYSATWAPDQSYEWKWSSTNQIYNGAMSGGGVPFVFAIAGCAAPPYQGYCEFQEVQFNAFTVLWYTTGYCAGWNASLQRIVRQACSGASYQAWAGTGGSPDGIWNFWVQYNYPHVCPIYGGYTQQDVTSDTGRGAVYLSCPQGAGGQSYKGTQYWYLTPQYG